MLLALKLKTGLAVLLAAPLALSGMPASDAPRAGGNAAVEMITLAPGDVSYRAAGDFARAGRPANASVRAVRIDKPLTIMAHQVTAAEYARCSAAGACPRLPTSDSPPDRPVVGVSWRDATVYAAWLSRETGERFRLPTDREWAYAAGNRYHDDVLPEGDANDPSRRWLARYEAESERGKPADAAPQPIGTFGANDHGLLDVGGNVWEWTDSCFVRGAIEADGEVRATLVNCGVRLVEGAHRTFVSDFIRDARAGGCAVGTPPSNLGFRLVREDDALRPVRLLLARLRQAAS
jgi:formylglycine-generating enzyme required for sulfatase activity